MTVQIFRWRCDRAPTLSLLFAHHLEECHGYETSGGRDERITSLEPLCVFFATQDVKEVSLVKCQLLCVAVLRLVVVQGFDDLLRRQGLDRFGGDGEARRLFPVFVALQRSANGL